MRGYYEYPERQLVLRRVALSWKGVPFFLNGDTREGAGCAGSQKAIHFETGALWEPFKLPKGTGRLGDQLAIAHMSRYLVTRPEFFQVDGDPEVGDIITGKTISGEYHLGTYLGKLNGQERSFVHCVKRYGISFSNLNDPTYEEKLVAVWRIKHEDDR